ncbi:MAG: alanine/glycine:cation symporter family protein [Parachlamydiaceae bacterium]
MFLETTIAATADYILFAVCLFILAGSIFISIRTRFVQIRFIPSLFKMLGESLFNRNHKECHHTIAPHKALFTAMSTTVGISTIVAPVIAISLGGPGALVGFLLTAFFGSAATYTEVNLCIQYRKKMENGVIMGGPMQYLKSILSPSFAKWYAVGCFILMAAWSSAQANQLAAILNSPLLEGYRISPVISGVVIAILVVLALLGGIKRISSLSSKLVPMMFILYLGSCLWIILYNIDRLGDILSTIFHSALSPYALASGTVVGGVISSLRWGVFKGIQTCEAGVGTQTIPHSMAKTDDPIAQGTLAMLSTYTAGCIAFLSGIVALMTETWLDPNQPLGISMVAASFHIYFSSIGIAIVVTSTFLFAFGTILGNSFNGSQCFNYLTENKNKYYFLGLTACMVFLGAISEVKTVWSLVDIILAAIAIPHMTALILHAYRNPHSIPLDVDSLIQEEEKGEIFT